MSRKHYREAAQILASSRRDSKRHGDTAYRINAVIDEITHEFGGMFKRDNPNFDKARFYRAAGLEEYQ